MRLSTLVNHGQLQQLEDDLLYRLSTAEGDITENVELIESLEASKRLAMDIADKVLQCMLIVCMHAVTPHHRDASWRAVAPCGQ